MVVREADEKEVEEEGEESQSQRPGRPGRPRSPLAPFSPARKRPERNTADGCKHRAKYALCGGGMYVCVCVLHLLQVGQVDQDDRWDLEVLGVRWSLVTPSDPLYPYFM